MSSSRSRKNISTDENVDDVRRSKRQRKTRYVHYGEHTVLKLNDYSLEDGESSIYQHEGRKFAEVEVAHPKPQTSFQLFCAEKRSNPDTKNFGSQFMKKMAELWRALNEKEREVYEKRSREMKESYYEAKKKAIKIAEDARMALEKDQQRILKEQNRKQEQLAREMAEKKRQQRSKPKKKQPPSARQLHNNKMKSTREEMRKKRAKFMAFHKHLIEPFVPLKVLNKLPKLSEVEIEDMRLATVDLEAEARVEQPQSIIYGKLRPYQLKGLEWMLYMYRNNTNMILGDEMGLGKTLQTISFLAALKERGISGPHLVVVPLSVLSAWLNEFRRWCPSMRVVRLHSADRAERERLRKSISADVGKYDVILTTYDLVKVPEMRACLASRISWRVVALDEGHRVKNHEAAISIAMKKIQSELILLLTGTPLQNNLRELWGLLYYLHPESFTDMTPFESAFELNVSEIQINREMLEKAHYMLRPFMLRRLKTEVEKLLPPRIETKVMCPLSDMQRFWYKRLLLKNKATLMRVGGEEGGGAKNQMAKDEDERGSDWKRLKSLMMQLRKCCCHPFLFAGAEDSIRGAAMDMTCDESIVQASGKMENLDRLLSALKAKGHRVVIFSQFTRFLDIVDDYLRMRNYEFARLDGATNRVQRMVDIQEFNKPNSPYFAFIMTTRAGGLGVNLQTADTVILLDSDWNPQVDMQAMARCHRIGQKKIVHVYRFICEGTMEERVVERAQKKLFLDSMVNRGSTLQAQKMDKMGTKEIFEALTFGIDRVLSKNSDAVDNNATRYLSKEDIEELIERVDPAKKKKQQEEEEKEEDDKVAASTETIKRQTSSLQKDQLSTVAKFNDVAPMRAMQLFEGLDYSTLKNNSSMKDIALAWAEDVKKRGSVRNRKSRFVTVDGYQVSKQNMYSMKDGEPSVLEREAKEDTNNNNSSAAAAYSLHTGRQVAGRDYDHMAVCMNCWDGGSLICCDFCPAAYHLDCLGGDPKEVMGKWTCPSHSCSVCFRKAAAVGGMLFRCEMCPTAYCEDHLSNYAQDHITNKCKRFINMGQIHPKQACFILCSPSCQKHYKASNQGTNVALAQSSVFSEQSKQQKQADQLMMNRQQSESSGYGTTYDDDDPIGRTVQHERKGKLMAGRVLRKVRRSYEIQWNDDTLTLHSAQKVKKWLIPNEMEEDMVDLTMEEEEEEEAQQEALGGAASFETMQIEDNNNSIHHHHSAALNQLIGELRPDQFARIGINCNTKNNMIQKRLSRVIELQMLPGFTLGDIEGFRGRFRAVHLATKSRLHALLYGGGGGGFNENTVQPKVEAWAGVATEYPDIKAPTDNSSDEERAKWKETVAELYLRLVRGIESDKSQSGFSGSVMKDIMAMLDLKVVSTRNGTTKAAHQKLPKKMWAEVIAMFLTFPTPGSLQTLSQQFYLDNNNNGEEEHKEEEEEEEELPTLDDNVQMQSSKDICRELMAELNSRDPKWSRKVLAEEIGVGHRQLLKWIKEYDFTMSSSSSPSSSSKAGGDCCEKEEDVIITFSEDVYVAGLVALKWLIHNKMQDFSYALYHHRRRLSYEKDVPKWNGEKDFDSDKAVERAVTSYSKLRNISNDPKARNLMLMIRNYLQSGNREMRSVIWTRLAEMGWRLEKMYGETSYMYFSPNNKPLDDLRAVHRWFSTATLSEEQFGKQQSAAHKADIKRLLGEYNAALRSAKMEIDSLINQHKVLTREWCKQLASRGWKKRKCVKDFEGHPKLIPHDMLNKLNELREKNNQNNNNHKMERKKTVKNEEEESGILVYLVSPCSTIFVSMDDDDDIQHNVDIARAMRERDLIDTYRQGFDETLAEKKTRLAQQQLEEEESKLSKANQKQTEEAQRNLLLQTLWELKCIGVGFEAVYYQRGQWRNKYMLNFSGKKFGGTKRINDYAAALRSYQKEKFDVKREIEENMARISVKKARFRSFIDQKCSVEPVAVKPPPKRIVVPGKLTLQYNGKLYVLDNDENNKKKVFKIGRKNNGNDMVLSTSNISRFHCEIDWKGVLKDLKGRTTSFTVNGVKKKMHKIKPGDLINIRGHKVIVSKQPSTVKFEEQPIKYISDTDEVIAKKRALKADYEAKLAALKPIEDALNVRLEMWRKKWEVPPKPGANTDDLCKALGIRNLQWQLADNGKRVIAEAPDDDDEEDDEEVGGDDDNKSDNKKE